MEMNYEPIGTVQRRAIEYLGSHLVGDEDEGCSVCETPTGLEIFDLMDPGQGNLGSVRGYHDNGHP